MHISPPTPILLFLAQCKFRSQLIVLICFFFLTFQYNICVYFSFDQVSRTFFANILRNSFFWTEIRNKTKWIAKEMLQKGMNCMFVCLHQCFVFVSFLNKHLQKWIESVTIHLQVCIHIKKNGISSMLLLLSFFTFVYKIRTDTIAIEFTYNKRSDTHTHNHTRTYQKYIIK